MPATSRLNILLTSALTLIALQVFVPTVNRSSANSAQANGTVRYQPPKRNTPQRTEGTGVRSATGFQCPTSPAPLFIATIAPTDHPGQTVSARPTLYAYFTGTEAVQVRLRDVLSLKPLWQQTITPTAKGFLAIPYPSESPALVAGRKYRWSVEVVCDRQKTGRNQGYTAANLQLAEPSPELKTLIEKATTPIDRATVYADQGLWHDAVDTLANASLAAPQDGALRAQLIDLLEQGGLVKAAKQAREEAKTSANPQKEPRYSNASSLMKSKSTSCSGNGSLGVNPHQPSDRMRCP